ncbi:MAG TPA: hypothetical protein VFQ65_29725 [Kofleriaceae bacterium]|nr:hypothetical protein [Kofleriaceae bacterium]
MLAFTIVFVIASVGGTITWGVWSVRRELRRLHALPRTPIRDLVGGSRVRVIGTARRIDADVSAIYTGTPCLACHGWMSGAEDADLSPPDDRVTVFRVEDDTGSIPIQIDHVKLELTGTSVDVAKSKVFGASIIEREAGAAPGQLTYWEDRLDADTRVAVIGYVVRGDDGDLRLAGRENEPLVIANVSAAFE